MTTIIIDRQWLVWKTVANGGGGDSCRQAITVRRLFSGGQELISGQK